MKRSSGLLRLIEIALCIAGICLLGFVLGESLLRWDYQAQQERALERGPAVSVPANEPLVAPEPAASPVEIAGPSAISTKTSGPPELVQSSPVKLAEAPAPKIRKKRIEPTFDPTALGRIEIPRLGVMAIVKEGADEGTLARAVGLVRGSARPGEVGNMVLAGHRDTFFRPLRNIKVNDRIRMVVPPNTYEYEVQSLRVVAPEETSVLGSKGVEELTLVTCFPFRFIGPAPDRFIVSATRVN
jgi:LPXTG-site transpeptidase (sortase) family protein